MQYHNLRKNKEREEILSSNLIHNLSLPVNSILMDSANLLEEIKSNDERLIEDARHLYNEALNLHLMINNTNYGINRGILHSKPIYRKCSLFYPLRDACEMFSEKACSKGLKIRLISVVNNRRIAINTRKVESFPQTISKKYYIPEIIMDEGTLAFSFQNILKNAVDYSFRSKGSEIERYIDVICEWKDKAMYKITIRNNGICIEASAIENGKIWELGWRSKLARDRNRTGSGFGLSFAKNIIEEVQKGSIEAQSILMNDGGHLTSFIVTLPVSLTC